MAADFYSKLFGKVENLSAVVKNVLQKKVDMRAIQAMSDRLQVTIGPYWHSMSKYATKYFSKDSPFMYATGHNGEEIGKWFYEWDSRINGYYFMNDGKRWDAHMSAEALKAIRAFWRTLQMRQSFEKVMKKLGKTRGFTQLMGWFYKIVATRRSGDSHTSIENTFINFVIHVMIFDEVERMMSIPILPGVHYVIAAAGDDCIAIVNELIPTEILAAATRSVEKSAGMTFKPVMSKNLYDVDFLSSLFYPVRGTYVLGPKIGRILSRSGWKSTPLAIQNNYTACAQHMRATALGLQTGTSFVPLLNVYFERILQITEGVGDARLDNRDTRNLHFKPLATRMLEADAATYSFVLSRYDMSVTQLFLLEDFLTSIQMHTSLDGVVEAFERDIA
jgi:hypothetical protein